MPSLKKVLFLDEVHNDSDDDNNENNVNFLKDIFTIDDFYKLKHYNMLNLY